MNSENNKAETFNICAIQLKCIRCHLGGRGEVSSDMARGKERNEN